MRVTLLTVGSRGDVQPFVALGVGLRAAGYDVRLATHPRYAAHVAAHDLAFAPLAEGHVSRGTETAEGRRWIERGAGRLPTVAGFVRDARSVADQRLADAAAATDDADVVVASNLALVLGWQVAARRGVPFVRAYIEPPAWLMTRRPARRAAPLLRQVAWLAARPWLNGVRRRALGAPPVGRREPFGSLDRAGAPVLYAFSPAVLDVPRAAGAAAHVTGYWFLDGGADPDPPPGLEAFLADGPPPVSVGFGSMIDHDPTATLALVAEALERAGRRGVLIRGEHRAAAEPPPHVLAVDTIAHAWLFPRCSAAVHYAPAGTTAAALRAGIPSVAVPQMTDQFLWARRLHELGVAPAPLPRRGLTAEALAEAIRATEAPAMRRSAATLGERIRAEDGVAAAVDVIARLGPPIPVPAPAPTPVPLPQEL